MAPARMISVFVAVCLFSMVHGRCPSPEAIPMLDYRDTFSCARVYTKSHRNPALSCTGTCWSAHNGENSPRINGAVDTSAIIVRPGCTFLAYEELNYKGKSRTFTGSTTWWQQDSRVHFFDLDPIFGMRLKWKVVHLRYKSASCFCGYTNAILRCKPKDEYSLIKECRNYGTGSMQCTHAVAKGTTVGKSVTNGKSVSNSIESSLSAALGKVFSLGLKYTRTTSYNWSQTDSKTFSKVTTTTVSCSVPPGQTLKMYQVIGKCDDSVVYTGHYQCRTTPNTETYT